MTSPYEPPPFSGARPLDPGPTGPVAWGGGYGPSALPAFVGTPRTDGKAVVALGLAVAAWLPVVPFIGAIAGLILARLARRDILASGGALTGLGLVTAARIIAWLHLLFVAVVFAFVVAVFLGLFAFSLFGHHIGG